MHCSLLSFQILSLIILTLFSYQANSLVKPNSMLFLSFKSHANLFINLLVHRFYLGPDHLHRAFSHVSGCLFHLGLFIVRIAQNFQMIITSTLNLLEGNSFAGLLSALQSSDNLHLFNSSILPITSFFIQIFL